jgi:hypothetical protein
LDFYFQVLLRWGFKRLADYLGGNDLPSRKSVRQKTSNGYPINYAMRYDKQYGGETILQSGKWSQLRSGKRYGVKVDLYLLSFSDDPERKLCEACANSPLQSNQ